MAVDPKHLRSETEQALAGYDDSYLTCRDMRHHFKLVGFFHRNGEVQRLLFCANCPMEAVDHLNSRMQRVKPRSYRVPDDYSIEGGVSAEEVRREMFRRHKMYASEETLRRSAERAEAKGKPKGKLHVVK